VILTEYNGSLYVTLPSDISSYYFSPNAVANFRTKLATPSELETDMWDVGLIEMPYAKGYKNRLLHDIIRLD
jgi:hypothetical protein